MPELDLECLSTELFILAFNPLASEVLLCKLLGSWYLVLYFFGWIVDFYYVGIHSSMCIFYLNFINCSILALLLTAVTCFLSRIWRCCRSELSAKITDGPLRLFENLNISSSLALSWFLIQIRSSLSISELLIVYECICQEDLCTTKNRFYEFDSYLSMTSELRLMCLFCICAACTLIFKYYTLIS